MTLTKKASPAKASNPATVGMSSRDRNRRTQSLVYIALIVGVTMTLLPFAWMLMGSFKSQGELLRNPNGFLPQDPTLENYRMWFFDLNFGQFFTTSLIVAVVTVLGNLIFCSMVGYALAKLEFPGKRVLFALVMITLMVPGVVTFVPLFVLVGQLGLLDTYPALILPFLTSPLGVFLMRQFIGEIPDALSEAARIDGVGEFGIFFRIILPLCGAPMATLGILTFLASWNNFLWPLVAAQTEAMYTLPVALSLFSTGQSSTNYALLLAGSTLVVAPMVLLFLSLQRFFIQSVASAGIK